MDDFKEYECVRFSSEGGRHFVKQPIILRCGHYICKACVVTCEQKCSKCGETNTIGAGPKESVIAREMIKRNVYALFEIMKLKFTKSLNDFKAQGEVTLSLGDRINSFVEHSKFEIEIRIESLKNELDSANQQLQNQLDELHKGLLQKYNSLEIHKKMETNYYENRLNELSDTLKDKLSQNNVLFYAFQDDLMSMNQEIEAVNQLKSEIKELAFEPSTRPLESKTVGSFNNITQLNRALAHGSYRLVDVPAYGVVDMCSLPNGHLAVSHTEGLTVYDHNFSTVLTINQLNGKQIKPRSFATNNVDRTYISDVVSRQILMTDLNFNFIKSTSDQLHDLLGVHYMTDALYVCESHTKCIQKLNKNLNFLHSYKLSYSPEVIKTNDTIACVRACDTLTIYFHDLADFSLKRKYEDDHCGKISVINSSFYEFQLATHTFFCYNSKGELANEFKTIRFADGALVLHNGSLVLSGFQHLILIDT